MVMLHESSDPKDTPLGETQAGCAHRSDAAPHEDEAQETEAGEDT